MKNNLKLIDGETGKELKDRSETLRAKYIIIQEGVTSIGEYAFYNCTSLTSITIPDSVTSIGENAFSGCTSLTSITIGNSVTSIGKYAFLGCTSLTSITIPDSVTSISYSAFSGCTSLTSITIPDSVTNICSNAFTACSSLKKIVVDNNNKVYDSRDNCNAIIETATNSIIIGCANTLIPNSVTRIEDDAFSGCTSLTSITIPNSVTSIGALAVSDCTSLTSITIPDSVTSIGEYAFSNCSSLKKIVVDNNNKVYDSRDNCNAIIETATNSIIIGCANTLIPNSVTSIEEYAFSKCTSLTSITIPNSVTNIGSSAFLFCISLRDVHYNGKKHEFRQISERFDAFDISSLKIIHCIDGDYSF